MKRALSIVAMLALAAVPAAAQTKGKISIGGSVTYVIPTDGEVDSLVGFGPLIRLNPKKGLGLTGGASWFRADVENPDGSSANSRCS